MSASNDQPPVLHLLCGKIASGKSTLAGKLAEQPHTVLISEDTWLAQLYAEEITTLADYVRRAGQLRAAMSPHIGALLRCGLSVVLDFPANTLGQRRWMKELVERSGVAHRLHFFDIPDALCKQRLRARNAEGLHPYAPSDAEFDQVSGYFLAPSDEEGFMVIRYEA